MKRAGWLALSWLLSAISLYFLGHLIPGIQVRNWLAAAVATGLIIGLDMLGWTLLLRFAPAVNAMSLGLAGLAITVTAVYASSLVVIGFHLASILDALLIVGIALLINALILGIFRVGEDDRYLLSARRFARRHGIVWSTIPGVVFVEIDGLSCEILRRAMASGHAPTLAAWLKNGSHQLVGWETDWSSQTGASQAGILLGSNEDMPAFRWWEKERQAPMVTNHPVDTAEIERRHQTGHGLLAADGASRGNMFSGNAPHRLMTMSTLTRSRRTDPIATDYLAYFASPNHIMRTLGAVITDVVRERWSAWQQERRDIRPRIRRTFGYALIRAYATVIQRDFETQALVGDLYTGRPVVYATFIGYDEVAHHSGPERPESLAILCEIDRKIAQIAAASSGGPRPYRFVILADHGQSQGAPFRQRYGQSLAEVVRQATGAQNVLASGQGTEAAGWLAATVPEVGRTFLGRPWIGSNASGRNASPVAPEPPEVVVMGSGCLGLIYFPRIPGRLTLDQIDELYPSLIPTLRRHPGVGFLLVRGQEGSLVLGPRGIRCLNSETVRGEDPLTAFGLHATRHIKREDGFAHVADIVVNAAYDPRSGEVSAFEELVGSHGGLGGAQSFPFLLIPADFPLPREPIVGAECVHRWLRRWLADLGHESYRNNIQETNSSQKEDAHA